MPKRKSTILLVAASLAVAACTPTIRHEVAVEPIEATLNINLRVDRELEDFFDFKEPPPVAPVVEPTNP